MRVTLTPAAQFRFLLLLPPFGSHWWGTVTVSNSVPLGLALCYQNDQFPSLLVTRSAFQHHMPFKGEKIPLLLIKQMIVDVL